MYVEIVDFGERSCEWGLEGFGLVPKFRTMNVKLLRGFDDVLAVGLGDLVRCLVAQRGVQPGAIVKDLEIFGNSVLGYRWGGEDGLVDELVLQCGEARRITRCSRAASGSWMSSPPPSRTPGRLGGAEYGLDDHSRHSEDCGEDLPGGQRGDSQQRGRQVVVERERVAQDEANRVPGLGGTFVLLVTAPIRGRRVLPLTE
jgi:hypothetical protein